MVQVSPEKTCLPCVRTHIKAQTFTSHYMNTQARKSNRACDLEKFPSGRVYLPAVSPSLFGKRSG